MTDGDQPPSGPAAPGPSVWPPPHPSPPLPAPRAYGVPGTPRDPRPYAAAAVAAALVVAVVVGLFVALHGDDTGAATPVGATTAADRSDQPDHPDPSASQTTAAPAAYTCWDGSSAGRLKGCPMPDGATGLAWVFPHLAEQRCGRPTSKGPGVVLRVICLAKLSDGSRIWLGYYQWTSVHTGVEFYEGQHLVRSDGGGFHHWVGGGGDTGKSAMLYVAAPFSLTVTLPSDAVASPADLAMLQPRPANRLRGEPVG